MSNAFTNFLGSAASGILGDSGGNASMKDYQHADRLYVRNNYARTPKVNFLYFVNFNINPSAVIDKSWLEKGRKDVGLLVKRIELPKFSTGTETLNQYNRKTVVQTKLTYSPVSIEFHDDNSDITNDLWQNYYQYYYMDSVYGSISGKSKVTEFGDTKYKQYNYAYGLDNFQSIPFFDSIDIYVMHKGHGVADFTQITLVNPMITEWTHDTVSQEDSRTLTNKMQTAYETVVYKKGKIVRGKSPVGFAPVYYDTTPSPIGIGGSGNLFGPGGVIDGANTIFGENGLLATASNPLDYLGVALQAKTLVQNAGNLNKSSVAKEGYSIASGILAGSIAAGLSQPSNVSNTGGVGNNGITIYSNRSTDGTTNALLSNITTKK